MESETLKVLKEFSPILGSIVVIYLVVKSYIKVGERKDKDYIKATENFNKTISDNNEIIENHIEHNIEIMKDNCETNKKLEIAIHELMITLRNNNKK